MPFNINTFNSRIAKSGIGRTNYFDAYAFAPGISQYGYENLPFRIERLNLPGRNIQTFRQQYHGVPREMPFLPSYQPCSMSIIMSQDYRERELFMRWQDNILGHYRQSYDTGYYAAAFDTKYYNDYIGTIIINVYSNLYPDNAASNPIGNYAEGNFDQPYVIFLEEAFPISVNDVAMAWGDEGYARLDVEIRYRFATEQHDIYKDKTKHDLDAQKRPNTTAAVGGGGVAKTTSVSKDNPKEVKVVD